MLKQKKIRTNKENGKIYIGSSVDLGRRLTEYFSLAYIQRYGKSSIICKAIKNHGHNKFKLEILELCKPEECVAREQHYLDTQPHEYNILPVAGSTLGYNHSVATRQKMREAVRSNSKAVLVTNMETGDTVSYISQSQAARELGVSVGAIRKCIKRKKSLKKTYIISFKSSD